MAVKPRVKRPGVEKIDAGTGKTTVLRTRCLAAADDAGWTQGQKDDLETEMDDAEDQDALLVVCKQYFDIH